LIVLAVSVVILLVLSQFLVRATAGMFEKSDHPLPLATRWLLGATSPLGLALGAAVVAGLGALFVSWFRTEHGYRIATQRILRLPAVGPAWLHLEVATLLRSLAALYSAGVTLMTGLSLVGSVTRLPALAEGMARVREEIEQGKTLAEALATLILLPAAVTQFVAVGEESGTLAEVLTRLADWYDQEVDRAIDVLVAAM
jgi:type IV pilus assembly protein PilC